MNCWTCGAKLPEFAFGKVPFRAECEACKAALHCCKNCTHHKLGLPNDCNVPNTEFVRDKAANNLCEDFKLLGKATPGPSANPKDIEKRLFKD